MAEQDRLGLLEVRVARENDPLVGLGAIDEDAFQPQDFRDEIGDLIL